MIPSFFSLRCTAAAAVLALAGLMPATAAQTEVAAIHGFAGGDLGERPVTLLSGADGKLYGSSGSRQQGNASGVYGTVFRVNQDGTDYTLLHAFRHKAQSVFAVSPQLVAGSDGHVYGYVTSAGNDVQTTRFNNLGLLFKIDSATGAFSILYEFAPAESDPYFGAAPNATGHSPSGLLERDGVLYGLTSGGGAKGRGTAFRFDLASRQYTLLHTFNVTDTLTNPGQLSVATDGNLYGLSGTRPFQLLLDGNVREIVPAPPADGVRLGTITLGPGTAGGFYGSATSGANERGALFTLRLSDAPAYEILHSFDAGTVAGLNPGTDPAVNLEGRNPGGLVQAGDASLFGYGTQGGIHGSGTLFRFQPAAGNLEVKYTFPFTTQHSAGFSIPLDDVTPNATGAYPRGALTQGTDGAWYGVASHGGAHGLGTVYRVVFGDDDAGAKPDVSRWEMLLMEGREQPDGTILYARPWGDPYSWPGAQGEVWLDSGYTAAIDWASVGATTCSGEGTAEPAAGSGLIDGGVGSIYGAYPVNPVQPWAGVKPTSGRYIFFLDAPGSYTYTLRCQNAAGEVVRSVRIEARGVPQPGDPDVPQFGNGGGALSLAGLLLAATAAWRRRRVQPGKTFNP